MLNLPPANRPPLGKGPTGKDKVRSYSSRSNTPLLSEYRTRDQSPLTARTGSSTPSSVTHQVDGLAHSGDNGVQDSHWDTAIVLSGDGDTAVHGAPYVPSTQTYTGRYEHDASSNSPTTTRAPFSTAPYVPHPTSHHFPHTTDRSIPSVNNWSHTSFHRDDPQHFPYTSSSLPANIGSENQIRLTAPAPSVNNAHTLDGAVPGHELPHQQHSLGYGMRRSITDPQSYPVVDHSSHVPYSMQTPSPLRVPHTSRPPPNRLSHSPDYGP